MSDPISIALIGDYNPNVAAHVAIPRAIELAANAVGHTCEATWIATDAPELREPHPAALAAYQGIWCVPASPYASMEGALHAIRFAREQDKPFLGTCGGCQHALIEYARNVLGLREADHAESNPSTSLPLIAPLTCPLVEVPDTIKLIPGTRIAQLYGTSDIVERYHCSFGPSLHYQHLFDNGEMRIAGVDLDGQARAFELTTHSFYMLTLFQPERSAFAKSVHPLIRAYIQAMC